MSSFDTYVDGADIQEDQLGMSKRYHGIAKFVRTCNTPMTVSIQGDWGTGKTAAMKFILRELMENAKGNQRKPVDEDKLIYAIWFNTWQFSVLCDNSKLIVHLLRMMVDRLWKMAQSHLSKEELREFQDDNKKLLNTVCKIGKIVLVSTVKTGLENLPFVGPFMQGAIEAGESFIEQSDSAVHNSPGNKQNIQQITNQYDEVQLICDMKELIQKQIEVLTGKGKPLDRIYLFIDDLDRLEPIVAVELMEGIKNFIDCKGCVFVLAVDNEVVERGLQAKYGKEKYGVEFDQKKAKKFFDKIIQVPFRLPVNAYSIQDYVAVFLKTERFDDTDMAERYTALLSGFNESNPRTIKRSFNLLRLQQYINGNDHDKENNLRQYALLLFKIESEMLYESLFVQRIIQKNPDETMRSKALELLWQGNYDGLEIGLDSIEKSRIQALLQVFFTGDDDDFNDPDQQNTKAFTNLIQEMAPDVSQKTEDDWELASALKEYYDLLIAHHTLEPPVNLDKPIAEIAEMIRENKAISLVLKRNDGDYIMVRANHDNCAINLTFYTKRDASVLFGEHQNLFYLKPCEKGKYPGTDGRFGYYDHTGDASKPRITVNVTNDLKNSALMEIVRDYLDTLG